MDSNQTTATMNSESDKNYQVQILQQVSRTFALTIPQLPPALREVVSNAYLLCRIADTIEDDADMAPALKKKYAQHFIAVVAEKSPAKSFANDLYQLLSNKTPAAEKDLIQHIPSVIRITHSFNARQRTALERCVRIMCEGMAKYQLQETLDGLHDLQDMREYCYVVAGVVGEMLTELFCDYATEIDQHREQLWQLSVSFGQGLQMTNILKDIWEDHQRNACWLPRDIFQNYGVDLKNKQAGKMGTGFAKGLHELIGVARGHLDNALDYTLLLPRQEKGLRRFCLWAIGMAVLTLKNIYQNPYFTNGQQVKISRHSVHATMTMTQFVISQNSALRCLYAMTARSLPKQS